MNKVSFIFGILSVFSVFAVEDSEMSFKAVNEARAAFNRHEGEMFKGAKAADYRTLPAVERFDTAEGSGKWVLALPLKNYSRVKFVVAEFKDGAFVSGEVRKFGLKPEKLDAVAFAALREKSAILAVKMASTSEDNICSFYPAAQVKDVQQNRLVRYGVSMRVDPNGRYLSGLMGIDRSLGVDLRSVKYVYSLTTPNGDILEMGAEGDGNKMIPAMREKLEALHPEKKGLYSDRDIVDMFCEGLITYRPATRAEKRK